jgi:hypothetical protein
MLKRDLISDDHDSIAALGIAAAKGGRLANAFTLTKSGMSRRSPNTGESRSPSQTGLKTTTSSKLKNDATLSGEIIQRSVMTNRSVGNDKSIHNDVTNRSVAGDNSIRLNRSTINHQADQLLKQELPPEVPFHNNSAAPLGGNGSKPRNEATLSTKTPVGGPAASDFCLTGERAYFAFAQSLDAREEFRAFIRNPKTQRPSDEAWQEWCYSVVRSRRYKQDVRRFRQVPFFSPTDDPVELALRRYCAEESQRTKGVEIELHLHFDRLKRAALERSETETSALVATPRDAAKGTTTLASSGPRKSA